MAASDEKTPVAAEQVQRSSDFEVDSQDTQVAPSKLKSIKLIDNVRIGLTVLVLCLGITILGVSGDALSVYDSTHLSGDFFLPLWPDEFDLRPTIALCVGSAIVVVANIVALVFGKVKSVSVAANPTFSAGKRTVFSPTQPNSGSNVAAHLTRTHFR